MVQRKENTIMNLFAISQQFAIRRWLSDGNIVVPTSANYASDVAQRLFIAA